MDDDFVARVKSGYDCIISCQCDHDDPCDVCMAHMDAADEFYAMNEPALLRPRGFMWSVRAATALGISRRLMRRKP